MLVSLHVLIWQNPIFYVALALAVGVGALIASFTSQSSMKTINRYTEEELASLKRQNLSLHEQNKALQATIVQQNAHIQKLESTLQKHDASLISALDHAR
jgi:uncharacterized protein HemX